MPTFHVAVNAADASGIADPLKAALRSIALIDVGLVRIVHGNPDLRRHLSVLTAQLGAMSCVGEAELSYHECLCWMPIGPGTDPGFCGDRIVEALPDLWGDHDPETTLLVLVYDADFVRRALEDLQCQGLPEELSPGTVVIYNGREQPGQLFA